MKNLTERIQEHAVWYVRRWKNKADRLAGKKYSREESIALFGVEQDSVIDGNALTNQGINEAWTILCSAGGNAWDNTNAVLIVGTGSGAAAAGDTEATFTAGVKKAMDGGYPTFGTSQKATWRATYEAADANQAWNEFGVLNNVAAGDLLNRKVSAQGTKVVDQVWELSLEITLS